MGPWSPMQLRVWGFDFPVPAQLRRCGAGKGNFNGFWFQTLHATYSQSVSQGFICEIIIKSNTEWNLFFSFFLGSCWVRSAGDFDGCMLTPM